MRVQRVLYPHKEHAVYNLVRPSIVDLYYEENITCKRPEVALTSHLSVSR